MDNNKVITCPHCNNFVFIEELNCCIFRHAVMKSTNQQIDPHSSKEVCDRLLSQNLIFGCGKPFKIIKDGDKLHVEICDYI